MLGKTNAVNIKKYNYIQITIPEEYQTVEYIESNGDTYIDTELYGHSNMSCEIEASFNSLPNDGCLIGCRNSRNTDTRLYFFHYFNGVKLGYENYFGSGDLLVNTKYNLKSKLYTNDQQLLINDENVISNNNNNYLNTHTSLHIFGMNVKDENTNALKVNAKVYFCKIWENGLIVRYFLPVYNKITNEIGLFDIVNQKFHKNVNGTLNKGNDIEMSPINIDCTF